MTISTNNYFDATKNIDWNAIPASLKKTHDTLIPDASKSDWQAFKSDEDIRRVVEKYFGYIGKYVAPTAPTNGKTANRKSASKATKAPPNASEHTGEKQAREVAAALIRPYVLRGDTLDSIRKSWLGSSGDGGSSQVKGNKIVVDRVGGKEVNFSFSLLTVFNEIKEGANAGAQHSKQGKKGKVKDVSTLPQPKQVVHIPTSTAFIKRYIALHGKIKTCDQVLSLVHGLQKAITEQKIKKDNPATREIEKMQSELIALATSMGDNAKIEIDTASLAHYKQIAQGEEVRTSVRLLKSFISMNGKAYNKAKATALHKKMEKAFETIPKEDSYLNQLLSAAKALASYCDGQRKTIGIPAAALHGLGGIAAGHSVNGLGIVPGSGEGAIIRLLRHEGVKNLSEATLKKAFRRTVAPSLCLAIAKNLIQQGELSMQVLNNKPSKQRRVALAGMDSDESSGAGRASDLDILEMRLSGFGALSGATNGLGHVQSIAFHESKPSQDFPPATHVNSRSDNGAISAKDLAKMTFKTISYSGRFKDVLGDPAIGFKMMVYGKPFQGKSSFVIELSKELVGLNKGKVAYVCLEEGISKSMQKKVIDFGADKVDGLDFMGAMPTSFEGYGFIVIDSVSDRNISREHLRQMFLNNPNTCFICIFHSTKSGDARGGLDYVHDMDIALRIDAYKPFVTKNRFL